MVDPMRFQPGDRVRHALRPEWGEGLVDKAEAITHEGAAAQRLTIKFANHGRVAVNTALAELIPAAEAEPLTPIVEPLTGRALGGNLAQLPDDLTDPLTTALRRLRLTLGWFRFPATARGMIDWAIARTGLPDPLSRYDRPELERSFLEFQRVLQAHARQLLHTLSRTEPQATRELLENQPAAIREALAKALNARPTAGAGR